MSSFTNDFDGFLVTFGALLDHYATFCYVKIIRQKPH